MYGKSQAEINAKTHEMILEEGKVKIGWNI